ncbi:MAG TPA: hypothetical protein VGF97_15555 [Rhizomicrobium sp.]
MDKIGEIRRAYFEQRRPIKEIVRTLSVSRATVRSRHRSNNTLTQIIRKGSGHRRWPPLQPAS